MNIFKKERAAKRAAAVQTARAGKTLPTFIKTGLDRQQLSLYTALRFSLPVIDAAIGKIIRLIGNFTVTCPDKSAERQLNRFLREVPCGAAAEGIVAFLSAVCDSLLCYGTAVSELLISEDGRLCALYPASLENVELQLGKNPLKPVILTRDGNPVPHPERVLLCALSPDADAPFGNSLLKGLPFVSDILFKIYSCIGTNFERMGNLRFAITYKQNDGSIGEAKADEIAAAWSQAMKDNGEVRDFVAVGDVDIKVIGGEVCLPDISVPVRTMLEQIVAKTGLPPFLLGLSWSSTERMSSQQADILTSELEYYRSVLTPMLLKICRAFLRGEGYYCEPQIEWENITLQDELVLSQSRLNNARAAQIERSLGGDNE